MRLLLDTNVYVYMVSDIESLTRNVRAALEDAEHLKYLSIVSLQELITAFRTKGLLSNIWKNESEMIEFILHDPSVVIDNIDELVAPDDIIKIAKVLELNFNLIGLKVETKKGSKLGKVSDYTVTSDDFIIQQLIVKRPAIKSFIDPELTIHRKEIVEITDYKVVVKDEEKVLKKKAEKEDFVPNFVNPFREKQPGFAPADVKEQPKD